VARRVCGVEMMWTSRWDVVSVESGPIGFPVPLVNSGHIGFPVPSISLSLYVILRMRLYFSFRSALLYD
jgi:hypothetical protein